MKFKILYTVFIMALISGCYKDSGNYDLHAINKIVLSDSGASSIIAIGVGDTLKLAPHIQQSKGVPDDELKYAWSVYDNSPQSAYDLPNTVIDSTRTLSYVITGAPFTLGESYKLTFTVTDRNTGVSVFLLYDLLISNDFRQGWLLLEDKGGSTDMSVILPDKKVVHDLYTDRNASSPLGKPLRLEMTPFDVTDDLSDPGKRMYLVAENNAVELNYLTFEKKFSYPDLFFNAPAPPDPQYINWRGYFSGTTLYHGDGVIIDNGRLHYNLTGGFPGAKKWGAELLAPDVNLAYQIYPFVAGGAFYSSAYPMVVYDNQNQRFYSVASTALNAFPAAASNDVFDMNNVGMHMVYMDSSNVQEQYNAIMEDNGTPFYIRFATNATTAAPVVTLAKATIGAAGILQGTSFTSSTNTPHIYYSIGNQVLRYETTSNTETPMYTFPANEIITKVVYKKSIPGATGPLLLAATWDGAEGRLYLFPVSPLGDISAGYTEKYEGFARIADIGYKLP